MVSMPSRCMLQEGGETTRRCVGFTRPRWVLDSSLVLVVLLAPTPHCSPPCSPSLLVAEWVGVMAAIRLVDVMGESDGRG